MPYGGKFQGLIRNAEEYEKLKNGEIDWKPHVKAKMESVELPYEVFVRLMGLDKGE